MVLRINDVCSLGPQEIVLQEKLTDIITESITESIMESISFVPTSSMSDIY
jgi:hypothetical protein